MNRVKVITLQTQLPFYCPIFVLMPSALHNLVSTPRFRHDMMWKQMQILDRQPLWVFHYLNSNYPMCSSLHLYLRKGSSWKISKNRRNREIWRSPKLMKSRGMNLTCLCHLKVWSWILSRNCPTHRLCLLLCGNRPFWSSRWFYHHRFCWSKLYHEKTWNYFNYNFITSIINLF